MEFNYFLNLYKHAADLNVTSDRSERSPQRKAHNFATFKINFGRKDHVTVKDLLTLMNSKTELRGVEIGRIQLEQTESYFELDEEVSAKASKLFKKSNFKGRPIVLKQIDEMPPRTSRGYGAKDFGHKRDRSTSRKHERSSGRKYEHSSGRKRSKRPDRKFSGKKRR
jgi:ATP-dependent RNA helicase DeaD